MWDKVRDSQLLDDLDHAISIVEVRDGVAVLTYCNAAFERLSGYSLADLDGCKMRILRGPDTDPAEIATLNAALSAGTECRVTIQNLRQDGTPYWIVLRMRPIRDAAGTLSHFIGEHTDVTKQRRTDSGLDLHALYLSVLGGLTQDGCFHRDLEGTLTFSNDAYLDIIGLNPHETSFADLVRCIHPDDRWRLQDWRGDFVQSAGRIDEFRYLRPNGDITWALVRTAPLLARDGTVRGLVGVVKDLTSQKRAEQIARETEMLITLDLTAIIQCDLKQRPILWNESATRLYGWTRTDAAAQSSLAFLHTPEGVSRFENAWKHLLEHGSWQGELPRVRRDGRPLTVQAHWGVVRDSTGRPTSVLCSESENTTQRSSLDPAGLRSQRLQSIGEMASGIAHDLNNVLQPIMMTLDMFDEIVTDPKQRQWLSLASQSATRGAELLRGVLIFARGGETSRTETALGTIATDVAKMMRGAFPPNIAVLVAAAPDVRTILANPTQMHQLVMNLAINARDAMPNGGTLSLSVENMFVDALFSRGHLDVLEGPYVHVRVADTGIGMSPELLEQIFTPYYSTKVEAGGTGLGLAMVDTIVKAHGGFLRVYSEPGNGSAFSIFLPATGVPGAAARELAIEHARLTELGGQGKRILVVDDESTIREIAQEALERHGYRVIAVSSPSDALDLIRSDIPIDLVLTDLMMPGASGQSLIEELHTTAPKARIVAMSGLDRRDTDVSLGVPFLLKPFSSRTLLEALGAELAKNR